MDSVGAHGIFDNRFNSFSSPAWANMNCGIIAIGVAGSAGSMYLASWRKSGGEGEGELSR